MERAKKHAHIAILTGRGPAPIHLANDAGGLDIHSVNAASAASYAQTECKEAAPASQSAVVNGLPLWSPWGGVVIPGVAWWLYGPCFSAALTSFLRRFIRCR